MKKVLLCALCSIITIPTLAQRTPPQYQQTTGPKTVKYRLYLKDKKQSTYKVSKPQEFLSDKAIERRKRLKVKVDKYDLPVSPTYLQAIRQQGVTVQNTSKWNNTVVVSTTDTARIKAIGDLPFVDSMKLVYRTPDSIIVIKKGNRHEIPLVENTVSADYYGKGTSQITMLNAQKLHEAGYKGKGVTIAVIDGGFYNADRVPGLAKAHILGTKNFVNPDKSVYEEDDHGMNVLSCIAGNVPGVLVGTAPEASFYLLVSEDTPTEFMVEEDNWCAALEYADSVGADIATSSLGYTQFENSPKAQNYSELTGHTHINSRSASLAYSRGLIVVNSAGNSGNDKWKNIGFPADATDILAVGAVRADSLNIEFSSIGYTTDHRVKPDVTAQGYKAASFHNNGKVIAINGTSFSAPITAGTVALLRQAFPKAKPRLIMQAMRQNASHTLSPDNVYGYGIPNLWKAYQWLQQRSK